MTDYISREIKVFWPEEKEWYHGVIDDYHEDRGYHIQYYDGDDDWLKNIHNDPNIQIIQGENDQIEDGYDDDDENEKNDYHDTLKDQNRSTSSTTRKEYTTTASATENDFLRSLGKSTHHFDENENENEGEGEGEDEFEGVSIYSTEELPENIILLKGEITGASNLPIQVADEENSNGIFYRVLYLEGGSQSSMFRCKTPIYKSDCSEDLEFPHWEEGQFRFEMVLPGDTPAMDFTNLGDIIIALYKSRRNGGSDFLGQVSLSVQDFIKIGTVVRGRSDCECRSLKGSYVLVDRKGSIMGRGADVDLNLRLEWRKKKPIATPSKISTREQKINTGGGGGGGGGGSVSGNTKRSTSTTRPRSANSAATGRSTSTGRNGTNPHTYRRERQQDRVAKENEAMRQRLEKIGPKSFRGGVDRAGIIREAYRSTPTAATAAADASDQKRRMDTKSRPSSGPGSGVGVGAGVGSRAGSRSGDQESKAPSISSANLAKKSYSELVLIFEDLRTKVAQAQKDLQNQKLSTNKLKSQLEKHETLVERMKKVEFQSKKGGSMGGIPTTGGGAGAGTAAAAAAPSKSTKGTPRGTATPVVEVTEREECSYTIGDILKRNGLPENDEEITDQVLRELVAEHSALQQHRVSLMKRKAEATKKTREVIRESTQLKQEIDEVTSILKQSMNKIPNSNWNLHQPPRTNKLQEAKNELEIAKDRKKIANICGVIHDDISNAISQITFLDQMIEKKKMAVEKVHYDSDNWQAKLDDLHEENLCEKMKRSIALMRGSIYRLRRQERLSEIKSETDAIEMELLRHNLNLQLLVSSTTPTVINAK